MRIVISIFEWVASKKFSGEINAPALNENLIDGCQIDDRNSRIANRIALLHVAGNGLNQPSAQAEEFGFSDLCVIPRVD